MRTIEEIESYVNEHLNNGVAFECVEVKKLRTRANKRMNFVRMTFNWEKDGSSYSFCRRVNLLHVDSVIDSYINTVNEESS